jgi:CRP-like cAMP-binding protein
MSVTNETLRTVPAFRKLTSATLKRLAQEAVIISQPAGGSFYEQDSPPTGLFALQSGRVKLYRHSQKQIQILAIPLPGECFGAESLPEDAPSPCSAMAVTPAITTYFHPNIIRSLLTDSPDFQVALLELVSARLQQFVALVHNLAFRDVAARLATVLLYRAQSEGIPTDTGIQIDRLLSQQELASMVGTAREVINRTFKKFELEGLICTTPSHIFILDVVNLTHIAHQEIH